MCDSFHRGLGCLRSSHPRTGNEDVGHLQRLRPRRLASDGLWDLRRSGGCDVRVRSVDDLKAAQYY